MKPQVIFSRELMRKNPITAKDFFLYGRKEYDTICWKTAARKYAEINGEAIVMKACGDIIVFSDCCGKISQNTHKYGSWMFG